MAMLLLHRHAAAGDPIGEALELGRLVADPRLDRGRRVHLAEADLERSLHGILDR
jgi:hypothetical protein